MEDVTKRDVPGAQHKKGILEKSAPYARGFVRVTRTIQLVMGIAVLVFMLYVMWVLSQQ